MITGLLHLHSALRWVVLILLVVTIVDSLIRMYRPVNETDKKLALFSLISVHTQVLIGLILYFFGEHVTNYIKAGYVMKESVPRFWVVEHLAGMILAAVFITVGYSRAKRMSEKWAKHRMIFVYYLVGFLLIMLSIPWPWREAAKALGVGWI
ncbi:MAG: hypothetical protein ACOYLH_04745 [Flavobacteriales bacterium]